LSKIQKKQYYAARAAAEREMASGARTEGAAGIHTELAKRFDAMVRMNSDAAGS
jgi:hypothetical protein